MPTNTNDGLNNEYISRLLVIILIRLLVKVIPIDLPPFPWPSVDKKNK
ncbi:hypothetical protein [Orenia metallireducens]|jgi:hypothetical protein|nr:hypothetical protein [Orenia metallireducens]